MKALLPVKKTPCVLLNAGGHLHLKFKTGVVTDCHVITFTWVNNDGSSLSFIFNVALLYPLFIGFFSIVCFLQSLEYYLLGKEIWSPFIPIESVENWNYFLKPLYNYLSLLFPFKFKVSI